MFKDTLQISAELIVAAQQLHKFKFYHKWRVGDQFCVAADCELFWQNLYADCVYLVDAELINLIEEHSRQKAAITEDLERMVFIPRLEDIVQFCAATVLNLELKVEHQQDATLFRVRINVGDDRWTVEESYSGLRVATLRALCAALENYLMPYAPADALPVPI